MLIPVFELLEDFNVKPKSILHVGAHLAEESTEYDKHFNVPAVWIEAQPNLCKELRKSLNPKTNSVIEACVYDKDDELLKLNISSNSQSSSILHFGTHAETYPDVTVTEIVTIRTKRLDTVFQDKAIPDFINLDIQGVELKAIKSLGVLLEKVQIIYTEVNKRDVYRGCDLIEEVDNYLEIHGFKRAATRWWLGAGWGDALYVKNSFPPRNYKQIVRGSFRLFKFYGFRSLVLIFEAKNMQNFCLIKLIKSIKVKHYKLD
jgi:FkbM family methyltransferase